MKQKVFLISTICLLGILTSQAYGQSVPVFARDYEMATVIGSDLWQFDGAPLDELHVMSFIDGVWIPIPFQIDEKDALNSYFSLDSVPGLDSNDEIVFMAFDRGEAAPDASVWPDDDASKAFPRAVVSIIDTITGRTIGTVYVYRSGTLQKNQADYIAYTPPPASAADDRITGLTYTLGNEASNGFPNFLSIDPSVGGSGQDLADRFNIQLDLTATITIIFPINISITLTENDFENARVADFIDGQVRVLKRVLVDLNVQSVSSINDIEIPMQHTPYSLQLSGAFDLGALPSEVKSIDAFSLVFDFTDNAIPMTLFTPFNQNGVSVNGQGGENFDATPIFIPEQYPFHTTGNQGTVVNVFSIPELGNSQSAIFLDTSSRTGAHGFELQDNIAASNPIAGESTFNQALLPLGFTGFFLAPNLPNTLGEDLAKIVKTPIGTGATFENFEIPVPVELISFDAAADDANVELTWVTASETNNFGFDIERRAAENVWQKIAFVEGNGTTTSPRTYVFTDTDVNPGRYEYRLKQIDTDGSFTYSHTAVVVVGLPASFTLHQNFPNPFNPATQINYSLPGGAQVDLTIYNLAGQKVKTLVNLFQAAGEKSVTWNGRDDHGLQVTSGVYFLRLTAGEFSQVRKLILTR